MRTDFQAKYRGVCASCWEEIEVGQSVHYNADGDLVHGLHRHKEPVYDICPDCHLAKPCFC